MTACHNISGLMGALKINYKPDNWRLLIDSFKISIKDGSLRNGNVLSSIAFGHAALMKETRENIKQPFTFIHYDQQQWWLCGDLKVVALLLVLQDGFTQYCCILCEWDSCARNDYYIKQDWPPRQSLKLGSKNCEHPVYAVPKQMLLPSLIIKLGLMKNFTKSKDKTGEGFQYHIGKCPRRSEKYLRKGRLLVLQFVNLLKMKIFFASFMATKGLHLLHCSQW